MDGALERLIPLVADLPTGYWLESIGRQVNLPRAADMVAYFQALRSIPYPDGTARMRTDQSSSIVELNPEANTVWTHWFNDNLDRIRAATELQAGYEQKLPSQVARTALVLQSRRSPPAPFGRHHDPRHHWQI